MSLDLAALRAAATRIAPHVRRTPVLSDEALDEAAGARVFFKCENLQATGAFKARGAVNAIFALDDTAAAAGVVTHSSGNHGAAVARAAQLRGIPAHIVMPHQAPAAKVRNVERYAGQVTFCAPGLPERAATCARIAAATGATLVHPFDDYLVMAGQGTAALELLETVPDLELIVVPVGGGGLLAGAAVGAKGVRPSLRVFGAEPEGADDAAQSFRAGRRIPRETLATIADGLRTNCVGEKTFPLIRQHVEAIVTVSEAGIVAAMRELWTHLRVVVEPSAAVPWAAVREGRVAACGRRVGIILTGGNLDLDHFPWQNS